MYLLQSEIWTLMGISVLFGICDLRRRSVPVLLYVICAVIGAAVCIINERGALSVLTAMIPGILLILLSLCTEGGIGIGDGHYLLVAALFAPWRVTALQTGTAFLLSAAVSLGMILYGFSGRKNMKKRGLPFLAFMPAALTVAVLI